MRKLFLFLFMLTLSINLFAQDDKKELIGSIQKILKSADGIMFNEENQSVVKQLFTETYLQIETTAKILGSTTASTNGYRNIKWDSLKAYSVEPTDENREALWSMGTKVTLQTLKLFKGDKAKSLVEIRLTFKDKFECYSDSNDQSNKTADCKTDWIIIYCKIGDAYDFLGLINQLRKAK